MWSIASLARRGAWLCLLGSLLALVGFFLPYATFAPENLAGCLTSCVLDQLFPSYSIPLQPMPWGAGALLLLLLGSVVLAFRMLFFPTLLRKSLNTYLLLTRCTLIGYLIAAAFILFFAWVDVGISDGTPSATEVLSWIGVGSWFILAGLILTHIGGAFLERQEFRASA